MVGWLATIDWGGVERADDSVRELVGEIEQWSTAYAEGDLTHEEYKGRLLTILPGRERRYSTVPSVS